MKRPISHIAPTVHFLAALLLALLAPFAAFADFPLGSGVLTGDTTYVTKAGYGAYWLEGPGVSRVQNLLAPDFVAACVDCGALQLTDIEIVDIGDNRSREFLGLWRTAPGSLLGMPMVQRQRVTVDLPLALVHGEIATQRAEGYEMVDIEIYPFDGEIRFAAIWHPDSPVHVLQLGLNPSQPVAPDHPNVQPGDLKLVDFETWPGTNQRNKYAGLWRQDPGMVVVSFLGGLDWETYYDALLFMGNAGYRLLDMEIRDGLDDDGARYFGIWKQRLGNDHLLLGGAAPWAFLERLVDNPRPGDGGGDPGGGIAVGPPPALIEIEGFAVQYQTWPPIEGGVLHNDGPMIPPVVP
ncbi:MAG: hypothetical protein AAGN66_20235 [Acidobacteriota bacterium]